YRQFRISGFLKNSLVFRGFRRVLLSCQHIIRRWDGTDRLAAAPDAMVEWWAGGTVTTREDKCLHPHTFYSTLFEHQKRNEVFVIMSFAPEFDDRWVRVIEPCIREDLGLKANRVDYNCSGESIIHDILDGIAHARLVL